MKLFTVADETQKIRVLFRDYGVKHAASFVPELDLKISATEQLRRTDTFTKEGYF